MNKSTHSWHMGWSTLDLDDMISNNLLATLSLSDHPLGGVSPVAELLVVMMGLVACNVAISLELNVLWLLLLVERVEFVLLGIREGVLALDSTCGKRT